MTDKHYTKIISKKYYKMYDRYCYSILTDDLKEIPTVRVAKKLKTTDIITIKESKNNDKKTK